MAKNKMTSLKRITDWMKKHRTESAILVTILLVGAFLRLYKISGYMTFLGDEGRDAIIVRRFVAEFDLMLIGPGTSIGNMYLGPLYYYMMAPALLFANFSPVGPAVMVALLGILTVWFVWHVTRVWFPTKLSKGEPKGANSHEDIHWGALVAALLYALAPTIIIYSRSSWNPNIMPFFALLSIYALWRVFALNQFRWLVVMAIAFAFVMQSHYLGLILLPLLGFYWTWKLVNIRRCAPVKRLATTKSFLKYSVLGLISFLILMSPLVIFDARHGWRNFDAMKMFFTERQTTVSARPWTAIPKIGELSLQVNTSILGAHQETAGFVANVVVYIFIIFLLYKLVMDKKFRSTSIGYIILILWYGTALIGFGVYKQHIYDHYFGFLYPVPIILMGAAFNIIWMSKNKILKFLFLSIIFYLVAVNISENPLQYPPNRQYERSVTVSKKIIEESAGEPFNIAVIAERNYEGAYQYHLERVRAPFIVIEAQNLEETVTQQLFVICELPKEKCDPTHNAKAEIANFGWSKVEDEIDIFGVTIFKLTHSDGL